MTDTQWLKWARMLQSLAQTGIQYTDNPYDIERYEKIQALVAEIIATHGELDLQTVRGILAKETGPGTPKMDVRGVVFQDDAILMVREVSDKDRWTLPGGWADVNDSPSHSAVREVREESGYETRAVKLLALYDKASPQHGHPPDVFYIYKAFFLCEITGGSPQTSLETSEVRFFKEDELPPAADLSMGRVTPSILKRMFAHHRNPDLPTDFD